MTISEKLTADRRRLDRLVENVGNKGYRACAYNTFYQADPPPAEKIHGLSAEIEQEGKKLSITFLFAKGQLPTGKKLEFRKETLEFKAGDLGIKDFTELDKESVLNFVALANRKVSEPLVAGLKDVNATGMSEYERAIRKAANQLFGEIQDKAKVASVEQGQTSKGKKGATGVGADVDSLKGIDGLVLNSLQNEGRKMKNFKINVNVEENNFEMEFRFSDKSSRKFTINALNLVGSDPSIQGRDVVKELLARAYKDTHVGEEKKNMEYLLKKAEGKITGHEEQKTYHDILKTKRRAVGDPKEDSIAARVKNAKNKYIPDHTFQGGYSVEMGKKKAGGPTAGKGDKSKNPGDPSTDKGKGGGKRDR